MRAFLRLFLGGFLAVAGLGLASVVGGMDGLSLVVDGAVLALGMGVLMLGLVSPSVGWAALTAAGFLAWKIFGAAFPLGFVAPAWEAAILAGAQVGLAFWLWWEVRRMPEASAGFSVRRFFGLTGVLVVGSAAILVGGGWTLASQAVAEGSSGFVRLGLSGVELEEREFARAGQRVRLVGMMHIGRSDFYREVHASLGDKERVIVLLEGVTDREGVLEGRFSYGRVAKMLGLTSQETSGLQRSEPVAGNEPGKVAQVDYRHADVDVAGFSPLTLDCLRAMAEMFREPGVKSAMKMMTAPDSPFRRPGAEEAIARDLIERRNAHVLGEIRRALKEGEVVVVVPWGAMHLPGIEAELVAEGFRETRRGARAAILW